MSNRYTIVIDEEVKLMLMDACICYQKKGRKYEDNLLADIFADALYNAKTDEPLHFFNDEEVS